MCVEGEGGRGARGRARSLSIPRSRVSLLTATAFSIVFTLRAINLSHNARPFELPFYLTVPVARYLAAINLSQPCLIHRYRTKIPLRDYLDNRSRFSSYRSFSIRRERKPSRPTTIDDKHHISFACSRGIRYAIRVTHVSNVIR